MDSSPSSKISIKIITLGDSGVGKTCIMQRYCQDTFTESTLTTVGAEYHSKTINVNNKSVNLQVWDTAGQERYRAIAPSFIKKADVVLLTYAVDSRQSFEHVEIWLQQIKNNATEDICIILVGSKCDVEDRHVEYSEGETLAKRLGVEFFETSAKENINIDQVFMTATNKVIEKSEGPVDPKRATMRISTMNKDENGVGSGPGGNPGRRLKCCD